MLAIARALVFVILLPGLFGALLGVAAAVPGASMPGSPWLATAGIPAFCEIEAADLPLWLNDPAAHVVQVAESRRESHALSGPPQAERVPGGGVRVVAPDALVSARLRRDVMAGPVVVVSHQPALAYHFAAQLVRAGAPRVAVLRSGLNDAAAGGVFASSARLAPEP